MTKTVPIGVTQFVPWDGQAPTVDQLRSELFDEGYTPALITDPPDAEYGWHDHEMPQLLLVASGTMTMYLRSGERHMHAGDRLYLAPRERHAAKVGPQGVTYFDVERRVEGSSETST